MVSFVGGRNMQIELTAVEGDGNEEATGLVELGHPGVWLLHYDEEEKKPVVIPASEAP